MLLLCCSAQAIEKTLHLGHHSLGKQLSAGPAETLNSGLAPSSLMPGLRQHPSYGLSDLCVSHSYLSLELQPQTATSHQDACPSQQMTVPLSALLFHPCLLSRCAQLPKRPLQLVRAHIRPRGPLPFLFPHLLCSWVWPEWPPSAPRGAATAPAPLTSWPHSSPPTPTTLPQQPAQAAYQVNQERALAE